MTYTFSPHIAVQVNDFEKALEFYHKSISKGVVAAFYAATSGIIGWKRIFDWRF